MEAADRAGAVRGRGPRPRRGTPGDDARLTAVAILGGIDVRVPPGARVALSGLSLLGGRDVQVPPGDGPTIRVRAFAILGGVTIKPSEAPAG